MFSPGTAEDQCNRWDTHLILSKEFTEMFFCTDVFEEVFLQGYICRHVFAEFFLHRYYAAIFLQRCFSTHVCQFSSTKCKYIEVSNMSITSRACTNAVPCWDCPTKVFGCHCIVGLIPRVVWFDINLADTIVKQLSHWRNYSPTCFPSEADTLKQVAQ